MPEITTDEGILRILSSPVNDLEVSDIVEQLSISMPDKALGLSAPQIGIHKRAFIANLSIGSFAFINPTISWRGSDVPSTEACLSLPGITRCIKRSSAIDVSCDRLIGIKNGSVEVDPEPIRVDQQDAFIIQHETDHLDGVLIIDHAEVSTSEQLCVERERKRKQRVVQRRLEKANKPPPQKPPKMSAKRLVKQKKAALKLKRQRRTARKQEKIRVEIQERYRAEQEGLLKDQITSAESIENPESTEL